VAISIILVVLAIACAAAVADIVVESASSDLTQLSLFGTELYTTTGRTGIFIAAALVAAATAAVVASLAALHGRRIERRMAGDLDDRWQQLSERNAGFEARNELLTWRARELENQIEDLSSQRDEMIEEMDAARKRAREIREQARELKRAMATARDGGREDDIVILPDAELEASPAGAKPAGAKPADAKAKETGPDAKP
jgi:TolA-binding protein